jgi:hypothetical protein
LEERCAAGRLVPLVSPRQQRVSGAAGVEPPPELLAAAEAVLASLPWAWDTSRPFKHNLNLHEARSLGSCTLVRPWVTGPYGALLHVRCADDQLGVLRIGLVGGKISQAELFPSYKLYRGKLLALLVLAGLLEELLVAAREQVVALLALELEHLRGDLGDHRVVVADEDQRALVALQRLGERADRLEVEVVGRLVHQQQVGLGQRQLGQQQADRLAAATAP